MALDHANNILASPFDQSSSIINTKSSSPGTDQNMGALSPKRRASTKKNTMKKRARGMDFGMHFRTLRRK